MDDKEAAQFGTPGVADVVVWQLVAPPPGLASSDRFLMDHSVLANQVKFGEI